MAARLTRDMLRTRGNEGGGMTNFPGSPLKQAIFLGVPSVPLFCIPPLLLSRFSMGLRYIGSRWGMQGPSPIKMDLIL